MDEIAKRKSEWKKEARKSWLEVYQLVHNWEGGQGALEAFKCMESCGKQY